MKKIKYFMLSLLTTSNLYALQIHPSLGNDILESNVGLSFSYRIYDVTHIKDKESSAEEMDVQDIPVAYFKAFFDAYNVENAGIQPGPTLDGKPSFITFGYFENGKSIYPATCQNILLNHSVLNVVITKQGCQTN